MTGAGTGSMTGTLTGSMTGEMTGVGTGRRTESTTWARTGGARARRPWLPGPPDREGSRWPGNVLAPVHSGVAWGPGGAAVSTAGADETSAYWRVRR